MEIINLILVIISMILIYEYTKLLYRFKQLEKYNNELELKEWQNELNKKIAKANIYQIDTKKEPETFDLTFEDGSVETYKVDYEQTNT